MNTILLVLAVLPVVVLAVYVYVQDKQQKEPVGMLLKAFLFGILSILPAILLETVLALFTPGVPVADGLYTGFVVAGFSEELCKLVMLRWAVWKSRAFDEYFDGIVYATFVSLGFACVENLQYVCMQGTFMEAVSTGSMRAVLAVPGHFLFGVSMGYFFALARFQPEKRGRHLWKALLVPVMLHGTYDALLLIPEGMPSGSEVVAGVLFVVFLWFDLRLWKIGKRRLARLQQLSSEQAAREAGGSLSDLDWNV
mgnify:CR=1 FL=1